MSNRLGFEIIRFLAMPVTRVIERGDLMAVLVGGLGGGVAAGVASYLARWYVFPCAAGGILVGAFVLALAFPRAEEKQQPFLEATGLPREPGYVHTRWIYEDQHVGQLTLACEHALWSHFSTNSHELLAAAKQVEEGAWPSAGEIIPWQRVCHVELHRFGLLHTIVKHQTERGELKALDILHRKEREFGELEGVFREMIPYPWQHEEPQESLLDSILIPLTFLGIVLCIGAVILALILFVPTKGPRPELTVLNVGGVIAAIFGVFGPWIAFRAMVRPKFVSLRPDRPGSL